MTKKLIMVVPRIVLFGDNDVCFQGFIPADQANYEEKILKNFSYMERYLAEEDPDYKQPIAYAIVLNTVTKKVFAYRRSKQDANYPEKRLQGKWSWGVGGHIEEIDAQKGNPILDSMIREVQEEIGFSVQDTKLLGYINDDSNIVGKVHLGLLYLIETTSETIEPKDPEMEIAEMKSFEELQLLCKNSSISVENWSVMALNALKNFL